MHFSEVMNVSPIKKWFFFLFSSLISRYSLHFSLFSFLCLSYTLLFFLFSMAGQKCGQRVAYVRICCWWMCGKVEKTKGSFFFPLFFDSLHLVFPFIKFQSSKFQGEKGMK
jgi:hypothetical protein